MDSVVALPNQSELRRFVLQVLCDHDRLDGSQFPLFEAPVTRSGRVCGLLYELQGPRLMRSRAIWTSEEHRILFYDSTGARFAEVRLSEGPDPLLIQAQYDRAQSEPQAAFAERGELRASAGSEAHAAPAKA